MRKWGAVACAILVVASAYYWAAGRIDRSEVLAERLIASNVARARAALGDETVASTTIPAWGYKENGLCQIIGPTIVTQEQGESLPDWAARVRATRNALLAEFPEDASCPSEPPEPQ